MSTISTARVLDTKAALRGASEATRAGVAATPLSAGLAVLRVGAGAVFLAHGAQKLFVWGIPGVVAGFEGMGIPLAGIAAPLVTFLELLGGIALIFGLGTRVVGLGLAAVMLGATLLAHLAAGFFLPNGYEFTLTLFAISAALALTGPGEFSLDAVLRRRGRGTA